MKVHYFICKYVLLDAGRVKQESQSAADGYHHKDVLHFACRFPQILLKTVNSQYFKWSLQGYAELVISTADHHAQKKTQCTA